MSLSSLISNELRDLGAKGLIADHKSIYWESSVGTPNDSIDLVKGTVLREVGIIVDEYGIYLQVVGKGVYRGELYRDLGINDVLNLNPHEYGLLRLKYGLSKLDLYLPSYIKTKLGGSCVWVSS